MDAAVASPRLRASLLPRSRWAKGSLLLLLAFVFLRSVVWASVQPSWFAPDENYHWLYTNYLVVKGTVPDLSKNFSTLELYRSQVLTGEGNYFTGPRTQYKGSPHAVLDQLGAMLAYRVPAPPKPAPVLHPPGYYLVPVLIDNLLWNKVSVTRLTAMRYYSAALGALTVYFAWLLASAVLAREWQRLAAAALVGVQTILGFSASTLTNDVGVAASLTAAMAWCAWMLRGPPRARHGIGLGILLSVAVMMKATMLSLVLVIGATLLLQFFSYPQARRELWKIAAWTFGIAAVLAGWWYVYLVFKTHSILGERPNLIASHVKGPGLSAAPRIAGLWIGEVYKSYWFDYNDFEVRVHDLWFYLPVVGMVILAAGFAKLLWLRVRTILRGPEGAEMRIVAIIVFAAFILIVPPLALDTLRGTRGLPFVTEQARFLAPAYPGLAVIAILALRELTSFARRAFPIAVGVFVAAAFVFFCHTWVVWTLERFYGQIHGHWLRALDHASYGKPTFITEYSLAVLIGLALLAFIAGFIIAVWGSWRDRDRPEVQTSKTDRRVGAGGHEPRPSTA